MGAGGLSPLRDTDRAIANNFEAIWRQAGIGTGIHYPIPLHLQKAYHALGYREGDFPVTERAAAEILSLPMYPELGRAEQEFVVEHVLAHLHLQSSLV